MPWSFFYEQVPVLGLTMCVVLCRKKKKLGDDKLRRRGCNTSTPPSSTTHICCRYMHACTIKIHLKIILCFWVQQLGLAHCCPVHSLLMIYLHCKLQSIVIYCLILKINHTSYFSHIISAFDKFSSTFLLITMSFWLLGKVHNTQIKVHLWWNDT